MLKFVSGSRTQLSYGKTEYGREETRFAFTEYAHVWSLGNDGVLNSSLTGIRFRRPLVIL